MKLRIAIYIAALTAIVCHAQVPLGINLDSDSSQIDQSSIEFTKSCTFEPNPENEGKTY